MSKTDQGAWPLPKVDSEIQVAAADWVLERQLTKNWNDENQRKLDTWLNQSSAHRVAFVRLQDAWTRSERLAALKRPVRRWAAASTAINLRKVSAGLGAFAIVAAISAYYLIPRYEIFSTGVGERRTLVLSDGSKIELSTDTILRLASDNPRRAWLDKGEAFFRVEHNAARPFTVDTGDRRIVDLGTEFAVQRNADSVKVSLVRGLVQIESTNSGLSAKPLVLSPGETAVSTAAEMRVSKLSPTQMDVELSWRRGLLIFDGTPLKDVVASFNRYNRTKLQIDDVTIAKLRIDGTYPTDGVESFLRVAQHIFRLRVEERGGETILMR